MSARAPFSLSARCSELLIEPFQVSASAGLDGNGQDFRDIIGMRGGDGLLDLAVEVSTALEND